MASSDAASPDPGDDDTSKTILLGRYEIGRLLGCGAFAKVYHARDLRTGQSVAVKSISKARVAKSGLAGHVKKEIAVMRRLRHPNIVRLHEVLASRSKVHFVMEYAKGGELFTRIARAGRLPEDACRRYFQQLVAAVGYCHSRGVFHRDLKPENLLLDEHGELKVTDFGLSAVVSANAADGGSSQPSARLLQTLCGTPAYVAPEILAKKGYDGAKVDVWSCGVVLFVLGAGYLPFNDPNLMTMYRKIYKGEFRCPRWMSADMKRMIFRLLDTNPETRITIDEITRDPWFAKGFEESKFRPFHLEEPKEEEEDDDADRSLNAFDIISFSPGIDLSTLFDGAATAGSSWERFAAAGPPERVVERLEEVGEEEGVAVRRKGGRGWKVEMARGRNGDFMAAVAVRPLSAEVVVVEVRKLAGEGFWRDRIRPKLAGGGLTAGRRER